MLVVDQRESLLLVTQTDHARFSSELLSLWRRSGLPEHPRRRALLDAVREHDNGWREADAAPRIDPATGRPHDYRSHPQTDRLEIWRRGIERFESTSPYTALLVNQHALELHAGLSEDERWAGFLELAGERRALLLEAAGLEPRELEDDYRWLALGDLLSLVALDRWSEPLRHSGFAARFADGTLELDPLPLAGSTTFTVPCREIPARRYRSDADLGGELAAARWRETRIRVAAPRDGATAA